MTKLRLQALDEHRLRLSGLEPFLVHCLQQLPEILAQRDQPGVHERLFPNPLPRDAEASEEWHRLMDGDLRHLFLAAEEIVADDLASLADGQLTFPTEHGPAWMSALNQARLILGELHGITEDDLNRTTVDLHDPKQRAVLEIQLLGCLLHLFVEHEQHGGSS